MSPIVAEKNNSGILKVKFKYFFALLFQKCLLENKRQKMAVIYFSNSFFSSKIRTFFLFVLFSVGISVSISASAQDTIRFKGQISQWTQFLPSSTWPWTIGARFIPQLNYEYKFNKKQMLDFEVSANIVGNIGFRLSDSSNADGQINPYRLWARFSSKQFELRIGLQKINFGSASILRPLMWFDQMDARDPLKLTNGVYGLLGRYYFLNNTNVWLWVLHGNKELKTWETSKTNQDFPEIGGRIQSPITKGEMAFTYHFRYSDMQSNYPVLFGMNKVAENRFGIDGKWDLGVGIWTEAVWINKNRNVGVYTNQEMANMGFDYTFGLGNGFYLVVEQLFVSTHEKPFRFENNSWFTAASISYPITLFDQVQAMVYYDWTNSKTYHFVNWNRNFNKFSIFLMAYFNPKIGQLPLQPLSNNSFIGNGIQLIFVYDY